MTTLLRKIDKSFSIFCLGCKNLQHTVMMIFLDKTNRTHSVKVSDFLALHNGAFWDRNHQKKLYLKDVFAENYYWGCDQEWHSICLNTV